MENGELMNYLFKWNSNTIEKNQPNKWPMIIDGQLNITIKHIEPGAISGTGEEDNNIYDEEYYLWEIGMGLVRLKNDIGHVQCRGGKVAE